MGTKQLLLIVLGIFIVGVAVAISLDIFDTQFSGQIRDMTIQKMHDVSSFAVSYWKKPQDIGGGGSSYSGFQIPNSINEDELSWEFDLRTNDDGNELTFFMISKQLKYNNQPFFLQGFHQSGKLVSIKLFDPEKNKWETLFDYSEEAENDEDDEGDEGDEGDE